MSCTKTRNKSYGLRQNCPRKILPIVHYLSLRSDIFHRWRQSEIARVICGNLIRGNLSDISVAALWLLSRGLLIIHVLNHANLLMLFKFNASCVNVTKSLNIIASNQLTNSNSGVRDLEFRVSQILFHI